MGTKTAQDFIRNVRTNLDEVLSDIDILVGASGAKWTNTQLLEYVNKGKDRVWDLVRSVREDYFITTSASLSITATTKEYSLATGFRQLTGIKCTTSGYEYISFRAVGMEDAEFKGLDAVPSGTTSNTDEILYIIIGNSKIKFATYPPASVTLSYDYIGIISDYPLDASTATDINDELREYIEAYATRLAFLRYPSDPRLAYWDKEVERLAPIVVHSVSDRQIRDPEYVDAYDPY